MKFAYNLYTISTNEYSFIEGFIACCSDDSLGYEYPFTLKAVQKDGCTCTWCPWYRYDKQSLLLLLVSDILHHETVSCAYSIIYCRCNWLIFAINVPYCKTLCL